MKNRQSGKYILGVLWMIFILNKIQLSYSVIENRFLSGYLNDLLFVPCVMPILIYALAKLKLRHGRIRFYEIAAGVAVWSVMLEAVGPAVNPALTGDFIDVVMYAMGGAALYCYVKRPYSARHFGKLNDRMH